jgi:hypothetical protein
MRRGRKVLFFLEVVLILCLVLDGTPVRAQGLDRSITTMGPATAVNQVPITYTITLTLPPGAYPGFVYTDALAVGGSGGTIGFEVFECPFSPCPPNPTGDIPGLSANPYTMTIPVGIGQAIPITFTVVTTTLTLTDTRVVLVRVTPNFTPDGVITSTVTLPPDSNPSNNSSQVGTRVGQPLPVPPSINVPTLRDWGMLAMVLIFGGTAFYFMRKRKSI